MTIEQISFEGHDCVRLEDGPASVVLTTSLGPRILGLFGRTGNVMAVVPDATLDLPDGGRLRLIGGHRLWVAPEVPEVTYQPDERRCEVTEVEHGVRVEAPADGAGLAKTIDVRRTGDRWVVDHVVTNASDAPMTIAPWAVTQLRIGGLVDLRIPKGGSGLLPDRALVLWPYTDLSDERIRATGEGVRIDARPGASPMKVGAAPSDGRVAYRIGDEVFEKRIDVDPAGRYADLGAAVQVYVGEDFCELETLGPLRDVEPGGSAAHRESWTLRDREDDRP